jgi:hypothetical protein
MLGKIAFLSFAVLLIGMLVGKEPQIRLQRSVIPAWSRGFDERTIAENGVEHIEYKVDAAKSLEIVQDGKVAFIPPSAEKNMHQETDESSPLAGLAKILAPIVGNAKIMAQGLGRKSTSKNLANPLTLPATVESTSSTKSFPSKSMKIVKVTTIKAKMQDVTTTRSFSKSTSSSSKTTSSSSKSTSSSSKSTSSSSKTTSNSPKTSSSTSKTSSLKRIPTHAAGAPIPETFSKGPAEPPITVIPRLSTSSTTTSTTIKGAVGGNPYQDAIMTATIVVGETKAVTTSTPWYYYNPYASFNLYPWRTTAATELPSMQKRSSGMSMAKQRSLLRVASTLGLPNSTIPAVLLTIFFLVPVLVSIWQQLDQEWRWSGNAPSKSPASYAVGMRMERIAAKVWASLSR